LARRCHVSGDLSDRDIPWYSTRCRRAVIPLITNTHFYRCQRPNAYTVYFQLATIVYGWHHLLTPWVALTDAKVNIRFEKTSWRRNVLPQYCRFINFGGVADCYTGTKSTLVGCLTALRDIDLLFSRSSTALSPYNVTSIVLVR
jgi:hypothetical protein